MIRPMVLYALLFFVSATLFLLWQNSRLREDRDGYKNAKAYIEQQLARQKMETRTRELMLKKHVEAAEKRERDTVKVYEKLVLEIDRLNSLPANGTVSQLANDLSKPEDIRR